MSLIDSSLCAEFFMNFASVRERSLSHIENSPIARKLSAFVALSEKELAVLERLHQRPKTFVAGRDLVHQGQSDQTAHILASGWVSSYKI